MSNNHKIDISVEELIGTLKNTSLPTIIVEGKDDLIVYRTLEEQLSYLDVSILPVGGRDKVLQIFERLNKLPKSLRILFIVDKDLWVFTNIPEQYRSKKLITTDGYSIENDIFVDGELENLLRGEERNNFNMELDALIKWFSIAISRNLNGINTEIKHHPNYVLNKDYYSNLIKLDPAESFPNDLYKDLKNDFRIKLRGKTLLHLLIRNTNYKGREPKHTDNALLESVAIRPGILINRIKKEIKENL